MLMFAESPLRTMRHRGRRGMVGCVSQVESEMPSPHAACELINGLWADAIRNMDAGEGREVVVVRGNKGL